MKLTIMQGNVFEQLPKIPSDSIDLCITSPPYWGLRDYNVEGQLGAEPTMEAYLDNTLRWIKEVWRVLKPTGSFVLNIGDCFIGGGRGSKCPSETSILPSVNASVPPPPKWNEMEGIYKTKQLLSISSFAYCRIISETDFVCRGEHIWAKPNVPSPIRSRLKHSHEKLFWFVKDADEYYFDQKAWMKKVQEVSIKRNEYDGMVKLNDGISKKMKAGKFINKENETIEHSWRIVPVGEKQKGFEGCKEKPKQMHVAPFPTTLIRPYIQSMCPMEVCQICGKTPIAKYETIEIEEKRDDSGRTNSEQLRYMRAKANSDGTIPDVDDVDETKKTKERKFISYDYCSCWQPISGTVLDPFLGSGTTMRVAMEECRNAVGIDLNKEYIDYAKKRLNWKAGLNCEYELIE